MVAAFRKLQHSKGPLTPKRCVQVAFLNMGKHANNRGNEGKRVYGVWVNWKQPALVRYWEKEICRVIIAAASLPNNQADSFSSTQKSQSCSNTFTS